MLLYMGFLIQGSGLNVLSGHELFRFLTASEKKQIGH